MPKRIAVYVYEGISLFHVSVPSAIFSDAYQGNSPFSMTFCNEAPGAIRTSNGMEIAAAIDCCLNLLKEWEGAKAANHISRMMVSAPQRSGGQKQFLSRPVISTSSDDRLNAFVDKVLSDLSVPYTLEDAAKHCLMSKRTFTRHFHRHFSIGFVHWLKQARLNYSQELLEATPLSITHIAEKSGFNTEQNFRKQFKLTFSVSPMAWRKVFQEGR